MITRRNLFLQVIGGGTFALAFNNKFVYAKNKPRADKVLWGGLGYSVKQKEIEKTKLRDQQAELITKMKAAQDAEREQLRKEAADAVAVAKEKQRLEMVGWIVKSLLGVGIAILLLGFLLKSPMFIVSGIACLGLAYVAATIPFWVVATIMGIFVLVMVLMDPKTGKISAFSKKAPPPV